MISVAPAHTVVRMGMRGSEIDVLSKVASCMVGHLRGFRWPTYVTGVG
ncbi:hypothetical protein PSYAE_25655 [Pseudomonas amygdali pv. aesculi str. 0893_23]|nr:hypothetical protein PSYAE_25655 [Pseudomonas amygdali pv. aesculi str. 0893_23]